MVDDVLDCRLADGASILIRRCGLVGGPRLVLSHGNGLAIDGYRVFWELLSDRYELILFDFRNHGRNPLHGPAGHDWSTFADDLERVCDAIDAGFGARPMTGVFHSMAAITSLIHAQRRRWRWLALVLFDPPLYPPDGHPLQAAGRAHEIRMAEWAKGRPDRFATPAELAARFARSHSLRRWVPAAFDQMAQAILRPDPVAGDWVLCCPRECEAGIYATNLDPTIWSRIPELPGPLLLVCSDPEAEGADVNGRINVAAGQALGIRCVPVAGTTHLLQIERPRACVDVLEGFLATVRQEPVRR